MIGHLCTVETKPLKTGNGVHSSTRLSLRSLQSLSCHVLIFGSCPEDLFFSLRVRPLHRGWFSDDFFVLSSPVRREEENLTISNTSMLQWLPLSLHTRCNACHRYPCTICSHPRGHISAQFESVAVHWLHLCFSKQGTQPINRSQNSFSEYDLPQSSFFFFYCRHLLSHRSSG